MGIQNSKLLRTYCQLDSRFKDLAIILKDINKSNFPQAKNRIDSYTYISMALAYFQYLEILPKLTLMGSD